MEHNQQGFSYTYSASQRDEVEAIRRKYLPPQENKLETLRVLDRRPGQKATAVSLAVGVVCILVMGSGMSMCLAGPEVLFMPGIAVGLAGMAGAALAYPVYRTVLRRERERIAPEILRLADELAGQ